MRLATFNAYDNALDFNCVGTIRFFQYRDVLSTETVQSGLYPASWWVGSEPSMGIHNNFAMLLCH